MKLRSNKDLYNYLLSLSKVLGERGSQQLEESINTAAKQATGLSTEFLGEAHMALSAVLDAKDLLRADEKNELIRVMSQIDFALRR